MAQLAPAANAQSAAARMTADKATAGQASSDRASSDRASSGQDGRAEPSPIEREAPMRVELNSATVDDLRTLPGIGPKKAAAILELRDRRPFTRVSQLLRVHGIGRKTLRRIRPFLYIGPASAPSHRMKAVPVHDTVDDAPRGTVRQVSEKQ
jgi:competence protein ComEA